MSFQITKRCTSTFHSGPLALSGQESSQPTCHLSASCHTHTCYSWAASASVIKHYGIHPHTRQGQRNSFVCTTTCCCICCSCHSLAVMHGSGLEVPKMHAHVLIITCSSGRHALAGIRRTCIIWHPTPQILGDAQVDPVFSIESLLSHIHFTSFAKLACVSKLKQAILNKLQVQQRTACHHFQTAQFHARTSPPPDSHSITGRQREELDSLDTSYHIENGKCNSSRSKALPHPSCTILVTFRRQSLHW